MSNTKENAEKGQTNHDKRVHLNFLDGWRNLLSGLGGTRDRTTANQIGSKFIIPDLELTKVWYNEGVGKKIVTVPADDMARPGFAVKGDEDKKIANAMKALGMYNILNEALYWSRLYGGALIVADIDGTTDLEEPLNEGHGEVVRLRLFDRSQVQLNTLDLYDSDSPNAGEPEFFNVTPREGQAQFRVHESRCAWFKGEAIPKGAVFSPDTDQAFWGLPALQAILDSIGYLGTANQSVAGILQELVISKLKLGNLGELLAENNSKAFYDRMDIIATSKSVINMILMGQDEEFTRDTLNLSGVPDLLDRLYTLVATVSCIPKTKLTGEQQGGLSNNDNVSLQNYYTDIEAKRLKIMHEPLTRITSWVNNGLKVLPAGAPPVIEFPPVWEPPASDKVALMDKWSQAMERFFNMGVLSSEEIRSSTFGAGRTVFNITLMDDETPEPVNPNPKKIGSGGEDK
jgi:phage-related protein (TIGR01555 family)